MLDAPDAMNDLSREVSFLALSYPAENIEELRSRLGSIDFVPTPAMPTAPEGENSR
jgi:hypothetical protein